MKMLTVIFLLAAVLISPLVYAQDAAQSQPSTANQTKTVVYQCTMDGYASKQAGFCPYCGMKLTGKEMSAQEAEDTLSKAK